MPNGPVRAARPDWTLLSNHGHVLVCLARGACRGGDVRLRSVAQQVGITERSVYGIVRDLETAGLLRRTKVGRSNRYEIDWDAPLRHPPESDLTVGDLLAVLAGQTGQPPAPRPAAGT
jgi:hypothetical protein